MDATSAIDPPVESAQSYETWALRVRIDRLSFVVPLVALASVSVGAVTLAASPTAVVDGLSGAGGLAGVLASVVAVRGRRQPGDRSSSLVAVGLTLLSSAIVAAAFASHFGGVSGISSGLLVVTWAFGAVIMPRRPAWLALVFTAHAALYATVGWLLAAPPSVPWSVPTVFAAGIIIVTSGGMRRLRDDRRDFDACQRLGGTVELLEARRRKLERATEDLDRTARAQVHEALSHAKTTQELENRLLSRVAERSRKLASAVDRASIPEIIVAAPLVRDALVGDRARILDRMSPAPYDPSFLATDSTNAAQRLLVSVFNAETSELAGRVADAFGGRQLEHASVPRLVGAGVIDHHFVYRIVEHRAGPALFRAMTSPQLSLWDAVRVAQGLAELLAAAHAESLCHLALDPYRILLQSRDSGLTVHGLGLVQAWTTAFGAAPARGSSVRSTPAYQAPEQCLGQPIDSPAADTYALGVLLFEMIAKLHPLVAGLAEDGSGAAPTLIKLAPKTPSDLALMIGKMLAMTPDERPAMADVAVELGRQADGAGAPPMTAVAPLLAESGSHPKAVGEKP